MPRHKSPLKFFLLVCVRSFYPVRCVWCPGWIQPDTDLPVSVLMVVVPATAAAILVHREQGSAGVMTYWKVRSITKRIKLRFGMHLSLDASGGGVFLT